MLVRRLFVNLVFLFVGWFFVGWFLLVGFCWLVFGGWFFLLVGLQSRLFYSFISFVPLVSNNVAVYVYLLCVFVCCSVHWVVGS